MKRYSFNSDRQIILLCSTFILIIFSLFFFNSPNKLPSIGGHIIELQAYGFYPEEITVKKGETVTFVTRRNELFWPASNIHPQHDLYPAFDPRRAIGPGESWTFRFDKPGVWEYHEHLGAYYSTDIGFIRVLKEGEETEDNYPISRIAGVSDPREDCGRKEDRKRCWVNKLKSTMLNKGLEATFDLLAELYETDAEFALNCNDITHYVGGFAYRVFRNEKKSIVIPKSTYCNSGFYHGFIEVWFHNYPKIEEATDFCRYVEEKLGEDRQHAIYACYHGLGHGAYHIYHVGDWSDFSYEMEPIFKICEETDYLDNCLDGVFNAVNMDYHEVIYRFLKRKENPFRLCEQLDKYKKACYDGLAGVLLWGGEGELSEALDYVRDITDDELALGAMATLVQITSFKSLQSQDHGEIINLCHSLRTTLQEPCLLAYVTGLVEQGTPETEYLGGLAFCSSGALSQRERDTCFRHTIDYAKTYYSETEAMRVCQPLDGTYKDYCLKDL